MAQDVVVGVTGPFGSGCSEVAETLRSEQGHHLVRISDILENEAKERQILLPKLKGQRRRDLQRLGNQLRRENGNGILIQKALQLAENEAPDRSVVVDSIKNPGEVQELRALGNGYVIAVDASAETRWKRIAEEYDHDHRRFLLDDRTDKDEGVDFGQKVQKCVDLADVILINESDWGGSVSKRRSFQAKALDYATLLEEPAFREPRVRELVMNIAYSTSLRSKCISRQVGAVIALQRTSEEPYYVLAMGHNHVPLGSNDCIDEWKECYRRRQNRESLAKVVYCPSCGKEITEGRCPNDKCDFAKSERNIVEELSYPGRGLDICPAVHAEESAILQTSLLGGPSPVGGTMFTTTFPCALCAKMIVETSIIEVVYVEAYPSSRAMEMLKNAGVQLTRFEGVKAHSYSKLFDRSGT